MFKKQTFKIKFRTSFPKMKNNNMYYQKVNLVLYYENTEQVWE